MPYAPHVSQKNPPTRQPRHANKFTDLKTPRFANWNPSDEIQSGKSVYMRTFERMDKKAEQMADQLYRARLQAIQGVDEIIEDVLSKLKDRGELENTYGQYNAIELR